MTVSNPLQWPAGRPNQSKPRAAMIGKTMTTPTVVRRLREQLELIGVAPGSIRITTDVTLRKDGMPRSKSDRCPDVTVWFHSKAGKRYCLTSTAWNTVRGNLIAAYETVKSLRVIELSGCVNVVMDTMRGLEVPPEQKPPKPAPKTSYSYSGRARDPDGEPRPFFTGSYTDFGDLWKDLQRRHGYTAPPPVVPKPPPVEPWHLVLGIDPTATPEQIEKAFASLARRFHPDRNPGDSAAEQQFKKINHAYEQASRGRR